MKVTIENLPPGEEAEIIIRANTLSQRVMNLLHALQMENEKLMLYHEDGSMSVLHPDSVYYFESVDNKVFAYGKSEVSELKQKLYELEQRFAGTDFYPDLEVDDFEPGKSGTVCAVIQRTFRGNPAKRRKSYDFTAVCSCSEKTAWTVRCGDEEPIQAFSFRDDSGCDWYADRLHLLVWNLLPDGAAATLALLDPVCSIAGDLVHWCAGRRHYGAGPAP